MGPGQEPDAETAKPPPRDRYLSTRLRQQVPPESPAERDGGLGDPAQDGGCCPRVLVKREEEKVNLDSAWDWADDPFEARSAGRVAGPT